MPKHATITGFPDTAALKWPIIHSITTYGHLLKQGETITAEEFARRLSKTDRLEARVISTLLLKHIKE